MSNLILDFNNTYNKNDPYFKDFTYLDMHDIEGTDLFCSRLAERRIKDRIYKYSINGIHFIDNGNYHYITRFFIQKIPEPFDLIVFDHHTDMQASTIPGLLSCGNWLKLVLLDHPFLHKVILIGPEHKAFTKIGHEDRLISISYEDIKASRLPEYNEYYPIYISIDKDILSEAYAITNWNQGDLPLNTLMAMLKKLILHHKVFGLDLCGAADPTLELPDLLKAEEVNEETDDILLHFFKKMSEKHPLNV